MGPDRISRSANVLTVFPDRIQFDAFAPAREFLGQQVAQPEPSIVSADFDGPGPATPSIVAVNKERIAIYNGQASPGYMSIRNVPDSTFLFASADTPRIAIGDFLDTASPDLVVSTNGSGLARFRGTTAGTLVSVPNNLNAASIFGIYQGSLVAFGSRIRLYDARCTTAPAGFPAAPEPAFDTNDLCASIPATGTGNMRAGPKFITRNGVHYAVVVTSSGATFTIRAYEMRRTGGVYNLVAGPTIAITGTTGTINDIATTDTLLLHA